MDYTNLTLEGHNFTTQAFQFLNMQFSPGITVESTEDGFVGCTVNGKKLDCPGRDIFLSNDIRIIATATTTTFRKRIIRSPTMAEQVDP